MSTSHVWFGLTQDPGDILFSDIESILSNVPFSIKAEKAFSKVVNGIIIRKLKFYIIAGIRVFAEKPSKIDKDRQINKLHQ